MDTTSEKFGYGKSWENGSDIRKYDPHLLASALWYADQVSTQVNEGKKLDDIKVDLPISQLKPLHAKWVVPFYEKMQNEPHHCSQWVVKIRHNGCFTC